MQQTIFQIHYDALEIIEKEIVGKGYESIGDVLYSITFREAYRDLYSSWKRVGHLVEKNYKTYDEFQEIDSIEIDTNHKCVTVRSHTICLPFEKRNSFKSRKLVQHFSIIVIPIY